MSRIKFTLMKVSKKIISGSYALNFGVLWLISALSLIHFNAPGRLVLLLPAIPLLASFFFVTSWLGLNTDIALAYRMPFIFIGVAFFLITLFPFVLAYLSFNQRQTTLFSIITHLSIALFWTVSVALSFFILFD